MSDLIDRQALLEKKIRIPIARIVTEDKIIYRDVVFVKDIEALPSAEPKTPSNGSITSMNTEKMHVRTTHDCISRQEAKDAIDMALDHIDHVPPWVYDKLLNALNEVPSAENAQLSEEGTTFDIPSAEPQIIQCKDCRWWTKHDTTLQGKCKLHGLNPMPEWYCASGEVVE